MLFVFDRLLRMGPPGHIDQLRKQLADTPIDSMFNLVRLEQVEQETIMRIRQSLENDGVFCSSSSFRNLLMWAHYADSHRGAVIEFTPNIEKDSVFLASKPVKYSTERPVLYANPQEFLQNTITLSKAESGRVALERMVFTKSQDWEYEHEFRLYVPGCIEPGLTNILMPYHPEEVTSVFLGCRVDADNQDHAIQAAISINPSVRVFRASPSPLHYSLEFERII